MLHKCANPACVQPFRSLSDGKLFLLETKATHSPDRALRNWDGRSAHRIEHFWLCDGCAAVLTLSFEKKQGMVTVPLSEAAKKWMAGAHRTEMGRRTAPKTIVMKQK